MNYLLGPLLNLLAKALAMAGIYLAGQRAGSLKAANRSHKRAAKLRRKADEIDDEIAASADSHIRDILRSGADPD